VAAAAAAAPHNRKDSSLGSRAGAAAPFTVSRGSGQALQHAEAMDNPSLSVPEVSLQGMLSEDTDSEPSSEERDGTSPPRRRGRPPGKGRPAVHRRSILGSAALAPGRAPGTVRTPPYSIYVCRGYVVVSRFWQVLRYTSAFPALPPSPKLQLKVLIELLQASRAHFHVSCSHHHVQQRPLLGRQLGHSRMAAAPLRAPPRCASRWRTRRRTSSSRLPSCRCAKQLLH
jgi:hypothetical protein